MAKLTNSMLQKIMTWLLTGPIGERTINRQAPAALNIERVVIFTRLAILASTCPKKVSTILLTRPQRI
jgi:hypothetical protein